MQLLLWREQQPWREADSDYFPPAQPAMLNFKMNDLDALLDKLPARA